MSKKIQYTTMAANLGALRYSEKKIALIISLYKLVLKKKGKTDIMSISKLQEENDNQYPSTGFVVA